MILLDYDEVFHRSMHKSVAFQGLLRSRYYHTYPCLRLLCLQTLDRTLVFSCVLTSGHSLTQSSLTVATGDYIHLCT